MSDSLQPHELLCASFPFPSISPAAAAAAAKLLQSCPTLCDPIDSSLPGSSVHGIFQARVLEWGAIAFSVFDTKPIINRRGLASQKYYCLTEEK